MKLFVRVVALFAVFVSSAFAQNIRVDEPTAGQILKAGGVFTARLTLLPYISSLRQVAIVIGLRHCLTTPCDDESALDDILYQGPYNPTSQGGLSYQDFTLTVPNGFGTGDAALSVAHFYLVGAEFIPQLSQTGTTVKIA